MRAGTVQKPGPEVRTPGSTMAGRRRAGSGPSALHSALVGHLTLYGVTKAVPDATNCVHNAISRPLSVAGMMGMRCWGDGFRFPPGEEGENDLAISQHPLGCAFDEIQSVFQLYEISL